MNSRCRRPFGIGKVYAKLKFADHFTSGSRAKTVVDRLVDVLGDGSHTAVAQRELTNADVGSRHSFVIAVNFIRAKLSLEQNHMAMIIRQVCHFPCWVRGDSELT